MQYGKTNAASNHCSGSVLNTGLRQRTINVYSCLAERSILVLAIATIANKAAALCTDKVDGRGAGVAHSILNLLQWCPHPGLVL